MISEELFELIERDCVPGGTKENLKTASALMEWKKTPISRRLLLADAQTSGGLLLCVPPRQLEEVHRLLSEHRAACRAVIGKILSARTQLISIAAS